MSRRSTMRRGRREAGASSPPSSARRSVVNPARPLLPLEARWALAAAFAPLLLFWHTTRFGFLLDDYVLYQNSASLADLSSLGRGFLTDVGALRKGAEVALGSYYRPVYLALATLYYQIAGGKPFGWHLLAVLLAAGIGALAYALLRRVGTPSLPALLGSLLFSFHPSHVSSIAWASGIQELLATLFVLLSLLALLARPQAGHERRALAMSGVAFSLALLSKEVAVGLLPLSALWWWVRRSESAEDASAAAEARRFGRAVLLFSCLTIVYLAARVAALGALANPWPHAPGIAASLPSIPVALLAYFRLLLWPTGFSIFRPERPTAEWGDPAVLLAALALVTLASIAAVACRRHRALVLPLAWFGIWLLPVLNFWTLDPQWMVSDRYLLLPSLALPWLLAVAAPARQRVAVLGVAAIVCAGLAMRYAAIFADERTFVAAMELAEPTSPLIFAEKARQLSRDGRDAEALAALRRAVELDPRSAPNQLALGDLELRRGDLSAAETCYRAALAEDPRASRPFKQLALALAQAGRRGEALALLDEGVQRWPDDGQVQLLRAALLLVDGEQSRAEAAFARAVALRPGDPTLSGGLDSAVNRLLPWLVSGKAISRP